LNGLVPPPSGDSPFIDRYLASSKLATRMGEQRDARDLQRVQQEKFRVAMGLDAKPLVVGELCSGGLDCLAVGHGE